MNQHLTISNTIVKYLDQSLPTIRKNAAQVVIDVIEQNYVVSDSTKKHFQDIISEIENIVDPGKKKSLQDIIVGWLDHRSKFVECDLSSITTSIELSKKALDKIYFDPSLTQVDVGKLKKEHPSVEVHNENSFVKPQDIDKLKNCPDTIKLRDNIPYNIVVLFEPYLRGAKEIIFQDPFLPNNKAFHNFKLLVESVNTNNIVAIVHSKNNYVTQYGNKRKRETRIDTYDQFVEYIDQKNIHLSEWKSADHKERYIITDKVEIYIPGGLDLFNKDGTIRISEPDKEIKKISISYRNPSDEKIS